MNGRGFSLIELLATMAIIVIMAAVAAPGVAGMMAAADARRDQANALLIASGINTYNTLHPSARLEGLPASWAETAAAMDGLWPGGMSVAQCERAYALVEIHAGRARLKGP